MSSKSLSVTEEGARSRIWVGSIPVDLYKEEEWHEMVFETVKKEEKKCFFNSNANLVVLANTSEKWLLDAFSKDVDYVMCDGTGIQMGARLTGQPVPDKLTYNVWFWNFAKYCESHDLSMFFLGAKKEVVDTAAKKMQIHAPKLKIDFHHGYFNKETNSKDNEEIISLINSKKPHILVVGFGMPNQERWILENMSKLNVNAFFPCGGAFDFFAGRKPVAPSWIRKAGFEWAYRMFLEPRRLGKRYLLGNPLFVYFFLRSGKKPFSGSL